MEKTTMWQNVAIELLVLANVMLPIAYYFLH